ncbi:hypothetical protein EDB84DRAFT_1443484 [Lactarius hengduanensis]|nr:hypothetical protein EDB84DRAFT_1443484 [Lactarius hengduanensis]
MTQSSQHTGTQPIPRQLGHHQHRTPACGVAALLAIGAIALVVWRRQRRGYRRTSAEPSFPSEVISEVTVTPFDPTWPPHKEGKNTVFPLPHSCCGFTPMTTVVYDTSSVRPATQFLPRPGHPSPLRAGHANPAPPRPRTQREGCPRHVMNTCPDLAHPPLSTSPIQAPRAHNNNNNTAKAGWRDIDGGRNHDDPLSVAPLVWHASTIWATMEAPLVTAPLTLCAHNIHDGDRYLNHDRHVMTTFTSLRQTGVRLPPHVQTEKT